VEVATEDEDEPGAGATGGDETGGDVTEVSAVTQARVVECHQCDAMMLLL